MTIEAYFQPDFLVRDAGAATPGVFGTMGLSGVSAFATLRAALDSAARILNDVVVNEIHPAAAGRQRDKHHA
jgi:hypothetical protein